MPSFGDSYRTNNPYQQRNLHHQQQQQSPQLQIQHSQFTHPQRSISPPDATSSYSSPAAGGNSFGGSGAAQLSTVPGVGSGAGGNIRHRIYPKEFNSRSVFKPSSNSGASPLLSAFSNPAELFSRSFLSSSPGTGSSNHSSVAGSPPSSWPASYSNTTVLSRGTGGSVPQQRGNSAYPSFEEHLSRNGGLLHQQRMANAIGNPGSERLLIPGEGGYVCAMDSLDGESENVLCLGWEGGLDVWRVGKGSLDLLGRLEGLTGGVKGAKILPTPQRSDPLASVRPLVALTLHSPIYASSQEDLPSPAPSSPASSRPTSAASYTSSRSHHTSHSPQHKHVQDFEWQTSVELYSLSTRERIAVLFTSPLVPSPNIGVGDPPCPPPTWGNIKVEVGERTVAVGLGLSGEVYIFSLINVINPSEPTPSHPLVPTVVAEGGEVKTGGRKSKKNKGGSGNIPKMALPPPPKAEVTRGEWVLQAKVWTTVQVSSSGSLSSDGTNFGGLGNTGIGFFQNGIPVFSLQGRWLTYLPPPANSSVSAGGTVRAPIGVAANSVSSQAPSSPPSVSASCYNADGDEKLINRMAREVTQEVLRGAKWVGEHGKKAFQNYWNGTNGQGTTGSVANATSFPDSTPSSYGSAVAGVGGHSMNRGYPGGGGMSGLGQQIQTERQLQQVAGYTGSTGSPYLSGNGNPMQSYQNGASLNGSPGLGPQSLSLQQAGGHLRSAMHGPNDPILVSILDIGNFPSFINSAQGFSIHAGYQLAPLATFHPPLGVSYVSLAPGGLALLTASSKGDVYHVWDLMRVVHQKPSSTASVASSTSGGSNPSISNRHVRQIARFTRMTVAHTVDVVWSHPRGDKIAVLTDKGTAHFYDLPSNAYQWPPPIKPPPTSASAGSSPVFSAQQQAAGAVQAVQGAVSLIGSSTQPLLTAARRRSSNSGKGPSPTGGISVNYNNASAARSKDRGVERGGSLDGKIKSNAPHGVNKISLPGNASPVLSGSVKFLIGKELGYVGLIGGGTLVVYQKNSGGQGGSKKRRSINGGGILPESGLVFELPGLPDGASTMKKDTADEDQLIEVEKALGGFWNGKHHHYHHQRQASTFSPDDVYRKRDEQQQYMQHPLSFAEIETNPAYPPFHIDRRVSLMVYADFNGTNATTTSSVLLHQTQQPVLQHWDTIHEDNPTDKNAKWVFGLPIQVEKLNLGGGKGEVEFKEEGALEDVADAMESRLKFSTTHLRKQGEEDEVLERIIVTTKRKKKKGKNSASAGLGGDDGEGIFEDDCEVLDFGPGPAGHGVGMGM